MLRRYSINSILKMTLFIFVLFLFTLYPKNNKYKVKTIKTSSNNYHDIFLVDKNNYLSKTTIEVSSIETEALAKDLLTSLIVDSNNKNKIPNNFKAIIPKGTKIQKVSVNNKYITISFDKNILKTNSKDKMIEAIVYTLTSINDIKYVHILVDNEDNEFFLPEYSRDIGINKKYDIDSLNDINKVTIYYVSNNGDSNYYIPVTKFYNSNKDKIKVIIDELSSTSSYESNLMSFLNYDTKLVNYEIIGDDIKLFFNDKIKEDNKLLEEVIYSISYSIKDTIPVSKVHFYVNNKEIL